MTREAAARPATPVVAGRDSSLLEAALLHDRFVVIGGLAIVIAAAWIWIALGAGTGMGAVGSSETRDMAMSASMSGMGMDAMAPRSWTPAYATLILFMWWTMMVAMMLPGASPTLLLFARVNRKEKEGGRPYVPTAIFAAGYLTVWGAFSAAATLTQWSLGEVELLSDAMLTTSVYLGSVILIAAGIWQLTPIKAICLRHCRSPMMFLSRGWRAGRFGAFRMGVGHGAFCVGCCWFLMGLLFVGGIMNLKWIAALALFVLIEKTIPMGHWVSRATGVGLVVWGIVTLVTI